MTIYDEYFGYCKSWKQIYGEKTYVLMEVGSFFEISSTFNFNDERGLQIALNGNIQLYSNGRTHGNSSSSSASQSPEESESSLEDSDKTKPSLNSLELLLDSLVLLQNCSINPSESELAL